MMDNNGEENGKGSVSKSYIKLVFSANLAIFSVSHPIPPYFSDTSHKIRNRSNGGEFCGMDILA